MICRVLQLQHCKTRVANVSYASGWRSIHALGARRLDGTRHVGSPTHNQQQRVVSASAHTTRGSRSLAGGGVDPVNSIRITGKVLKTAVEYLSSNGNIASLVLGVKWFAGAADEEIDHIRVFFWKGFRRGMYDSALQIQEGTIISVVGNIRPGFDLDATGRRFDTITVSASECRIGATGQGSAAAYRNEVAVTGTVCEDPLVETVGQARRVTITLEFPRYWRSPQSHIIQVYFWGVEGDDEMCNQASRLPRGTRVDVLGHLVTSCQGTGQDEGPPTVQVVGDAVKLAADEVAPLRGQSMQHLMRNITQTTTATAAAPTAPSAPLEKIFGDDLLNTDAFLTSFCRGKSISAPATEDRRGAHGGADVTRPSIIGYMRSSDEGPFTPVYGTPSAQQPRLPFRRVHGQVAAALLQAPSVGLHRLNPDTTSVYVVGRDSLPHLSYDLPPMTPSIVDYAYPTDTTDITEQDTVFVLALESGPRLLFLYAKSGLLGTEEQVDDLAARYLQGKQYFTASQRSHRKEFTEGSAPQIYMSGYRTERTTREFGRYRKETLSEAAMQAIDGLSSTIAEKLHAAMPVAMEGVRQQGTPPATLGGSPFTSLSITEQYYNPIHVDENDVGEGLVLWLLVGKGLLVGGEFHVSTLRLRFLPGHGAVTFFNTSLLYHGTAPVDDRVSSSSIKRLGSALYVGQGTISGRGRPTAAEQPKNHPGRTLHSGQGTHD